jgi:hypothetical protein
VPNLRTGISPLSLIKNTSNAADPLLNNSQIMQPPQNTAAALLGAEEAADMPGTARHPMHPVPSARCARTMLWTTRVYRRQIGTTRDMSKGLGLRPEFEIL